MSDKMTTTSPLEQMSDDVLRSHGFVKKHPNGGCPVWVAPFKVPFTDLGVAYSGIDLSNEYNRNLLLKWIGRLTGKKQFRFAVELGTTTDTATITQLLIAYWKVKCRKKVK